jgi:ribosome maturation factor RimP
VGGEESGKVLVLLDGDEGISIATCAKISRSISRVLDEEYEGNAFRLEVSSSGADTPLTLLRQYRKHVGRSLEIEMKEMAMKGRLVKVEDDSIVVIELIESKQKHKKDKDGEERTIPFEDIISSKVIISFK